MSKLVAAVVAGTGGTAAAVGGPYLLNQGDGAGTSTAQEPGNTSAPDAKTTQTQDNIPSQVAPTFSFSDLATFKTATTSNVECIKSFVGLADLQGQSATAISSTENKIDSKFINASDTATVSKGCLIVNGDKKEYSDSKGNGNFKLLGTFEKGSKGFISFVVAKETEDKKLDLTGIFYALEKSESSGSITKKKEVSTAKKIDKTNSTPENNFPKVGNALTDLSSNSGWKMFTDKEELDNICVGNDSTCKDATKTSSLKGYGTGKGASDGKQLDGWTGNLESWGDNLYVKEEIAISTIASSEKGNGTKVDIKEDIPSTT